MQSAVRWRRRILAVANPIYRTSDRRRYHDQLRAGLPGNWEANPIMNLSQTHFGVVWWLPKVAAVGFAAVVVGRAQRRWPMFFAVSYYIIIVLGNLACL